jgi:hypothetical protein
MRASTPLPTRHVRTLRVAALSRLTILFQLNAPTLAVVVGKDWEGVATAKHLPGIRVGELWTHHKCLPKFRVKFLHPSAGYNKPGVEEDASNNM